MNADTNEQTPVAVDKITYAARWAFSRRVVDHFLSEGMPHLKIGERRVRIIVQDADAWMRERYGTRRVGAAEPGQTVARPLHSAESSPAKPRRKARQQRVSVPLPETV